MNRGSLRGTGLFLLCFLVLLSACGSDAGRVDKSSASPTVAVSDAAHATIDAVAATNEVVYLAGSDGSLTARQAENGKVIWHQTNLAVLSGEYTDLVPAAQTLYDAYNTTTTTARVEARQISNGQVVWSRDIPHRLGPGFVAMMVDAGMIYVNTIFPPNHGLLYALRASDGQIRWQYPLQGLPMDSSVSVTNGVVALVDNMATGSIRILHGDDGSPLLSYTCPPGSSWRPAVDQTSIYVYCPHRPLQAFRITDGTLLWTASNSSQFADYWRESQEIIYSNTGSMLKAFSARNGAFLWQTTLPDFAFGPSIQNQLVAVITQDHVVMAFHASNGTLIWKRPLNSDPLATSNNPDYTDLDASGYFLFGNPQTISVWRSSDGRDIWHGTTTSRIIWQPQVVNDRLYLWQFNGTLEVVDLHKGTMLWRYIA
ncbi:MAG: PQQ-binding-like beta-propeller repeat protein [Ktedonobacteraceae bacterium]